MKPKLLFVPHYIASLRYFEKLIPHLKYKYEICFLFLPRVKQKFLPEMTEYCKQKNYNFKIIEKPKNINLPVRLSPILLALDYKKKIKKLLQDKTIKKIIANNDTNFYNNHLFKKANKLGIDTMVLQWCLSIERNKTILKKPLLKRMKQWLKNLVMDKGNPTKTLGLGSSKKFGVINQWSFNEFKKWNVPESKMTIVGSMDFHKAEKVKQELDNNQILKSQIAHKFQINQSKTNIIVFSNPYNTKDVRIFSDKQQYEYFENIVKIIREIFPSGQTDILFKIHPAEQIELYKPLEKYFVKLFDKNTPNEELVYFSDLYICHGSTTNFIPMIMKKPCIFLNLLNLAYIDLSKKPFAIKQFVKTLPEFQKLLNDFKNNRLPLQYSSTPDILIPNSLQKLLNWIG